MKTPLCPTCDSVNCFIYQFTNKATRKKIATKKSAFHFEKGENVIREGGIVSGIYFIYKGKVKVFKSGLKNKTQIVRLANSGQILGHRGFGKINTYPIGASALEPSTICFIPKELFIDALNHNPALTLELMNFYADELRRVENKMRSLSQMTVKQKIAEAILTLAEIYGTVTESKVMFLNVTLSRQEYADITGASLEEVIRTISQLNKQGFIALDGKRIGILKKDQLQAMLSGFGPLRLP